MKFEIIDFHTHPFLDDAGNICAHQGTLSLRPDQIKEQMLSLGISRICGSVIRRGIDEKNDWERLKKCNEDALRLREALGDFYVPGFHVHPDHIEESIREMERMHKEGIRILGELVPYSSGWSENAAEGLSVLLDEAEKYGMIVSFHTDETYLTDDMIRRHKNLTFVAAHPGEKPALLRHIERARISENYYLDLSGTGLFRYGMLEAAVKEMGADRVLFGTDYPICTPGMYIGGVLYDPYLTDEEKQKILSGNAKRLLSLG